MFRVVMKPRPYEKNVNGVVILQWTKRKTFDKVLCIECGFDLINQRYATLINKGTLVEHDGVTEAATEERWTRGQRFDSVTLVYSLPVGTEFLQWAKDWSKQSEAEKQRGTTSARFRHVSATNISGNKPMRPTRRA